MFGMIGKITAQPGQGRVLAELMRSATGDMPGCRSYVIALDADNADVLWVTETWDSAEAHKVSLELTEVRATIGAARPLIAGFETVARTEPLG
ncbi:putative quinol monooxygenase [Pseudoruegeria sp. HB172150]|uniref:putative quinol monooxygenase n=1 Tax=Pseudoruegeria sp. HB172150 TaxID=2721164 RepID=UPI001557C67C|nr:antibiotic biosynthesis monooxygenase family protein [Pseudoruegeria sp. HB172150]